MSARDDSKLKESDGSKLPPGHDQPFPRVWVWGLCSTPTSGQVMSRPRAAERLTDLLRPGRELLIACPCSNRRGVDWIGLALLPAVSGCGTIGELARRLRCDACHSSAGRPDLFLISRPSARQRF
jgi:hypothetical protein